MNNFSAAQSLEVKRKDESKFFSPEFFSKGGVVNDLQNWRNR